MKSRRHRGIISEPRRAELDEAVKQWAQELNKHDFSIAHLVACFDRAMRDYQDTDTPFGVPQILAAAQALSIERRQIISTTAPARCEGHKLVEIEREESDPPLIASWRICQNCGAAFPKFNKSAPASSTMPAPELLKTV